MFKDMITLDNEDQTDCEQDKLAQNLIVCPRSLEVNSVKEIMSFSHKCKGNPLTDTSFLNKLTDCTTTTSPSNSLFCCCY